jgi:hypothetical protein
MRGMSTSPPGSPPGEPPTYIRAGGGVEGGGRRVVAVLALIGAVALGALSVALAVGAAHHNAQLDALRRGGVPVTVTVTGCLGISSGVGMGIEYWQCRGSYTFAGQTYNEVIGGNRQLLDRGQTIQGVAAAARPTVVSTAASAHKARASWASFVAPVLFGAAAVALLAGGLVLFSRSRSQPRVADRAQPAVGKA